MNQCFRRSLRKQAVIELSRTYGIGQSEPAGRRNGVWIAWHAACFELSFAGGLLVVHPVFPAPLAMSVAESIGVYEFIG